MISPSENDPLLNTIVETVPSQWQSIINRPDQYRLQLIYTQIDRDGENRPCFSHHRLFIDQQCYFYPASLVKLPVAALTLEKINALSIAGLNALTPMQVINVLPCSIPYDNEDGAQPEDPVPIASSIKRMLVASDNGGYNRLWEFLTRDEADKRLSELGYCTTRLLHRLSSGCSVAQNRFSNPIRFLGKYGNVLYEQPSITSVIPDANPLAPLSFGKASMVNGEIRPGPFTADFLNYTPLDELHRFLIAIMFPDSAAPDQPMHLRSDDYRLLRTWMRLLPCESGIPRYVSYPDNFKKFFLFGNTSHPFSSALREFNVTGRAYGFLSDIAYLADFERGIEFFLSATIYVNANGIVNDDVYEYDSIGRPFFAELCKAVYEFEIRRQRRFKPDLTEFLPIS